MEQVRKWKHKETGQIYKVLPWWDCTGELIDAESARKAVNKDKDAELDSWPERMFRVGVLVQVGWLLENDKGIWVGIGPQAATYFEEIQDESDTEG